MTDKELEELWEEFHDYKTPRTVEVTIEKRAVHLLWLCIKKIRQMEELNKKLEECEVWMGRFANDNEAYKQGFMCGLQQAINKIAEVQTGQSRHLVIAELKQIILKMQSGE